MGSQPRQALSDGKPHQATVRTGQRHVRLRRAMSGDGPTLAGGHGVAGSNLAVPTGEYAFSNICLVAGEPKGEPNCSRNGPEIPV